VTAITPKKSASFSLELDPVAVLAPEQPARELAMRSFSTVSIVIAVLFAFTVATRADGSWCAHYGRSGATNCGFHSFEQCQAAVSGTGGFCTGG
jgi:hypothetical protein